MLPYLVVAYGWSQLSITGPKVVFDFIFGIISYTILDSDSVIADSCLVRVTTNLKCNVLNSLYI